MKYPLITLGSPYGVGYEIFLRSLEKKTFINHCPFCIGSKSIMELFLKILQIKKRYLTISPDEINHIKSTNYDFILINIDDNNIIKSIKNISFASSLTMLRKLNASAK